MPFFLLANCPFPSLFLFDTAIYFSLLGYILSFLRRIVYNTYMKNPYSRFPKEDLILRDHLAIDRTILSNESTLLAYIRTSLAILAAGATLFHFFSEQWVKAIGIILIPIGFSLLALGYIRYKKMDESIRRIRND
jgi:putative membrane protein